MGEESERTSLPVFERTRLVDKVTKHLRELIISREIPPGSQLLQLDLAKTLGVSRTPLREAFRILERDGLVRISNGNRTVEVVRWTPEELRDLYEVREVVDGLAARLVARQGLDAELDSNLKDVLAQMEEAVTKRDHTMQVEAHAAFHALIAEHCGNGRVSALLPLIRMTSSSLHHAVELGFTDKDGAEKVRRRYLDAGQDHHRAVYEALRTGDERKAEEVARRHIRATLRTDLIERATPEN
ncbi:MAG: GntR family transcriptional regulator [Acidimicrobiales bacterium]|nr:GntR family transcriptional regulator [Acidimicrobiales bacterium]